MCSYEFRRSLVLTLLIIAAAAALSAHFVRAQSVAPTDGPLAAFEGHYRYRDDSTLYMVPDGDRLFAIIGDGKYPLRRTGDDVFANGSGDAIPFKRDAAGRVTAFVERGDTFARLSAAVPDTVRALLKPRPPAAGATAARYRYQQPSQLEDGLAAGTAGTNTLPVTVAEQLVNGVYGLGIWHRWYRVERPAGAERVDTIMLSGNGGQKIYIVPSLDLVVAFTGGAYNAESPVNTIMARVLLPALLP